MVEDPDIQWWKDVFKIIVTVCDNQFFDLTFKVKNPVAAWLFF